MFNPTQETNYKFRILKKLEHSSSSNGINTENSDSQSHKDNKDNKDKKETLEKKVSSEELHTEETKKQLFTKLTIEDFFSKPKQVELLTDKDKFFNFPAFDYHTAKSLFTNLNLNFMSSEIKSNKVKKINPTLIDANKKRVNKCRLAIQTRSLNDCLRFTKLVIITPQLMIKNCTKRDIYLYHVNKEDGFMYMSDCIREGKIVKIHYIEDCYDFFRMSFEDKPNSDSNLYSGVIKFNKSSGFYVKLMDREKELVLIFCKVYEIYGFLLVVIMEKPLVSDYPYFIVNYLNVEVKFKQSIFIDSELKEFSENMFCKYF